MGAYGVVVAVAFQVVAVQVVRYGLVPFVYVAPLDLLLLLAFCRASRTRRIQATHLASNVL